MNEKWTLAEGIQKLSGDTPEINDLGISKRQLCLDVSFTDASSEEGIALSVILSTPGVGKGEDDEWVHVESESVPAGEGESLQELAVRVAAMFNIHPDERVWENGENL